MPYNCLCAVGAGIRCGANPSWGLKNARVFRRKTRKQCAALRPNSGILGLVRSARLPNSEILHIARSAKRANSGICSLARGAMLQNSGILSLVYDAKLPNSGICRSRRLSRAFLCEIRGIVLCANSAGLKIPRSARRTGRGIRLSCVFA